MGWIPQITRRRFLAGGACGALAVGLYTWRVEPHWVEVVERPLPIANLPAPWQGRTLVHITDLHVGTIVDSEFLIASLLSINAMSPDLLAITGDFMTCHGDEHLKEVSRVLRHLQPARLGSFAVLGNHDYGLRWAHTQVASTLVGRLGDLGIRVLRNEVERIEGLQITGVDDLWGPNFAPERMTSQVKWNEPALTLCHNPDAVDLASMSPVRGWILSGHTHGGQCKPPFLPPPLLPVKNTRYTAGEFDIEGGRRLYINRGLGYLRRVRFNVRPEITVFRMERA